MSETFSIEIVAIEGAPPDRVFLLPSDIVERLQNSADINAIVADVEERTGECAVAKVTE